MSVKSGSDLRGEITKMGMQEVWNKLYKEAMRVVNPRKISTIVEAGGVAAAVESSTGKIYVGVCIDSACTLGICAERNAIFNMITRGESDIRRVIAVSSDGKSVPLCGACRELMTQLMPENYKNIEIILDYEQDKVAPLGELTQQW